MMRKVIVALSGGVDSSVVAALLLKKGYQVTAIHVKSWDPFFAHDFEGMMNGCLQGNDYFDAEKICQHLKIKLIKLDFTKQYWIKVFLPSLEILKKGLTPNPDIFCNQHIKFGILKEYVEEEFPGFYFATGHYANYDDVNNNLLKASDKFKDQTYFLAQVRTTAFKKVIFPLGKYLKKKVREIAKQTNLITHNKKDSTGLCFVGERDYHAFLANYIKKHKGKIINLFTNEVIGIHMGYEFYTIGQNKNLNLGGQKTKFSVVKKDIKNNIIFVAPMKHDVHYKTEFMISNPNWIGRISDHIWERTLDVRIRHQGKLYSCKFNRKSNKIKLLKKVSGIAPGQEAVFYYKDIVLGGAMIVKTA